MSAENSQLNPDWNNFEEENEYLVEEGFSDAAKRTVYEKEYTVEDRSVKAMVVDNSQREYGMPLLSVYIVYDSILVRVEGEPDVVESLLPKLSFKEIDLEH